MTAAGIDLSLTATGLAHSNGACATIGQAGLTKLAWADQLEAAQILRGGIRQFLFESFSRFGQPRSLDLLEVVVIEGLDMSQSYGGQILRSHLWCLVVSDLLDEGVQVYVAPSPQVKMYATGKGALPAGKAGKKLVIEAVRRQWPFFEIGNDDNKADAAVMCAMAAEIAGYPMSVVTPEQTRALAKTMSVHEVKG